MKEMNGKTFLTEDEALKQLGFTNRITLWRARRDGRLDAYRVGNNVYYTRETLDKFLESCRLSKKAVA